MEHKCIYHHCYCMHSLLDSKIKELFVFYVLKYTKLIIRLQHASSKCFAITISHNNYIMYKISLRNQLNLQKYKITSKCTHIVILNISNCCVYEYLISEEGLSQLYKGDSGRLSRYWSTA